MNQVKQSILEAIGNTPVVKLNRIFPYANVVAKLEFMNPGGSIKDRMVRYMLQHIPKGTSHVVEASSGNTGAALAMSSAVLGYRCEIAVPDTTSIEKVNRIRAYGADVHLCGASPDPATDYQAFASGIAASSDAFYLDQYRSNLNSLAHYWDTGPELWSQTQGEIDVFICGIGSGGTISGIGRFLKERNPALKVIGVEPMHSSYQKAVTDVSSKGVFCSTIEGVGKREPSHSFDPKVVDDVVQVSDQQALEWGRRLAKEEGMLVGESSGCVVAGIANLLPKLRDQKIATIFPDSGNFYLSKYY